MTAIARERRQHPRYPALAKATLTDAAGRRDAVCTNLGPGGACFSCRQLPDHGSVIELTMRGVGHSAPNLLLRAEVRWSSAGDRSSPVGFGVRWLAAESRTGPEPLALFLRDVLRVGDLGALTQDSAGAAVFDFVASPPLAASPATEGPRPAETWRMLPPLPPRTEPHPASPLVDRIAAPSAEELRRGIDRSSRLSSPPPGLPRGAEPSRPASSSPQPTPAFRPAATPPQPATAATPSLTARPTTPPPVTARPATPPPVTARPVTPLPVTARPVTPPPVSVATPPVPAWPPPPRVRPASPAGSAFFLPELPTGPSAAAGAGLLLVPIVRPPELRRRPDSHGFVSAPDVGSPATALVDEPTLDFGADEASWPAGVPRSLAQRYGHLQVLGRGGNGVVYRAADLLVDRTVVLKFMAPSGMAQETARKYFLREFKLTAGLQHPNIVRIHDIGSAEGVLYYAMEFLDGVGLGEFVRDQVPVRDPGFVCSVAAQLASALDFAHGQGVLHRDVKPGNVLVLADGTVKLFDFGLARVYDEASVEQSLVVGTPSYMAPEQGLRRGAVEPRSDQYSLGVVLFRLLTGQLPFTDGNVFIAHAMAPLPDPSTLNPDLPAAVAPVLRRMLAKQPPDRYPSCVAAVGELVAALLGTSAPG